MTDNEEGKIIARLEVLAEVHARGFQELRDDFGEFKESVGERFTPLESFMDKTKGWLAVVGVLLGSGVIFSVLTVALIILL